MPRFRGRFLHPSLRTGRASFQASGSPCVALATGSPYIRKLLFRVCGTPPIQLALHVENKPGIHRVRHIVYLLLAICIHCLPSPIPRRMLRCGRLSRPLTTTQAPPLICAITSRFGHLHYQWQEEARMRFPSSDEYPCVRFRSRLYPV